MKSFIAGSISGIGVVSVLWVGLVAFDLTTQSDTGEGIAAAQSAKKPQWRYTEAGTIPTEFGELVQVNGTSGNYTMVFKDTEQVIRLVDLRGGKIPLRAIVIKRKY